MADTVFKVELKGIELPKDVHSAIEADIRRAVMNHLGALAFKGDLTIAGRLGPGTAGIWAEITASKARSAMSTKG